MSAGFEVAGDVVVGQRQQRHRQRIGRDDAVQPPLCATPGGAYVRQRHPLQSIIGVGSEGVKPPPSRAPGAAAPERYTATMFPVSDVIPSRTTPYVTIGIITLNALAFIYQLTLSDRELQVLIDSYGVVPAFFSWTSLVTSMFLHSGWVHVLGNMLYLWIFGDNVEDHLGHLRYLVFYLGCGSVAALA